jgi:hypothetical protein
MAGSKFKEFVDRTFLGNRGYNYQTGQWNARGVGQGIVQTLAGVVNPASGFLARQYFNRQNQNNVGPVGREQFPYYMGTVSAPNIAPNFQMTPAATSSWEGFGNPFAEQPKMADFGNFNPQPQQAPRGPTGFQLGGAGMMGTNARHYGGVGYTNDAWGQTAAGFGVGAGNSGFANRQTGTDGRGNLLER